MRQHEKSPVVGIYLSGLLRLQRKTKAKSRKSFSAGTPNTPGMGSTQALKKTVPTLSFV